MWQPFLILRVLLAGTGIRIRKSANYSNEMLVRKNRVVVHAGE
jgi:hypothetical protein